MEKENLRKNLILGMGNPLLDITAVVDKEFLAKYDMKENDAILADEKKHKNLYSDLTEKYTVDFTAGGSVQNALRVAQWLLEFPEVTTFFGSVGDDKFSQILLKEATQDGVNVQYQIQPKVPTGTCAVLLTGTHRSLCANLAAANHFSIDHIRKEENRKLVDTAQFYYVSGFFLTVSPPSLMEVAKIAASKNRPFMMNLSAPFITQFYKEPLMAAMPYVDILFGNDTEAETFANEQYFGTTDLEEIAKKICDLPKENTSRSRICIITTGHHPVILAKDGKITKYPVTVLPKDQIVDTNGAGDAFVGGFLSQYLQGQDLEVCIKCGIWAATEIVKRNGVTYEGKANFQP